MEPAREPASSRPKPCASLKKPHESCPFAASCGPSRKKYIPVRNIIQVGREKKNVYIYIIT